MIRQLSYRGNPESKSHRTESISWSVVVKRRERHDMSTATIGTYTTDQQV